MRVLAPPTEAVMLFGEVGELEVEAERAEHERLSARVGAAQRERHVRRASAARRARGPPGRFDKLEQPRSFLLHEHVAEDRPEQADVVSERRGCVALQRWARLDQRLRVEAERGEHGPCVRRDHVCALVVGGLQTRQ